jgi:hypothetical protein
VANVASDYVFYLSDDDFWMPEHIETLLGVFEDVGADAVAARAIAVAPGGTCTLFIPDLASPGHHELMRAGYNRIGLSAFAHTRDAYRRLPHGWRTSPAGMATDLHMWQQWLAEPWPRYGQAAWPTVLCFPSVERKGVGTADRVRELAEYEHTLNDPSSRLALLKRTIIDDFPRSSFLEVHYRGLEDWVANREEALMWHRQQLDELESRHRQLQERHEETESRLADALKELEELRSAQPGGTASG